MEVGSGSVLTREWMAATEESSLSPRRTAYSSRRAGSCALWKGYTTSLGAASAASMSGLGVSEGGARLWGCGRRHFDL